MQIIHSIKDFFGLAGTTDEKIKVQANSFHGNFIGDQMPSMVQVTNAIFNNLKVKPPSLITIKQ